MTEPNKELQSIAQQAQAPMLADAGDASGQGALTPVQTPDNLVPVQPKHLTVEDIKELEIEAEAFLETVKQDPSNWELGNFVFNLGQAALHDTQAQVALYDRKMGTVLKNVATDEASPVAKNILAIKVELDKVNPSMVANTEMPCKQKMLGMFTRSVNRLPNGDEVLSVTAERRES
ncbi:MAG: hypothetical protein MI684_09270, partial [Chlorobiales bacterium]|nr:hypothetical protein [Chlorobiales bacterium]